MIQRSSNESKEANPLLSIHTADASDWQKLEEVKGEIMRESEHIDYLFLNATGVLHPMRIDPYHFERIVSYISRETAISLAPLTIFAPLICAGGTCVYSSSMALTAEQNGALSMDWVDWPHYVAAKAAVEGLINVARLEFPSVRFILTRLPTMDTGLTSRSYVAWSGCGSTCRGTS